MRRQHDKFPVKAISNSMDSDTLKKFLSFKRDQIQEEVNELSDALSANDAEEIVDALLDNLVFTVETLRCVLDDEDIIATYESVMNANYAKEPGIKPGRPNPFGFPDMIKPDGWKAPTLTSYTQQLQQRLGGQ